MARLDELGYLDDETYAKRRAHLVAERGYADLYIRHYLYQIGLPENLVDRAIKNLSKELPEEKRIHMVIKKKKDMEKEKLLRHLSQKGFSFEKIFTVLHEEKQ
jgi:SOS response regulatory protein OraA/RecX